MLLPVLASSERMRASSGEALSRILPYLSIILSMPFTMAGNVLTPAAIRDMAG